MQDLLLDNQDLRASYFRNIEGKVTLEVWLLQELSTDGQLLPGMMEQ
jgi:hypothetical protein